MSLALIMTYSIGLKYTMGGSWTHSTYINRQTLKLEGVVSVVVGMSASLEVVGSGPIHSAL